MFAAWLAWQLRYPAIGFDSAVYHYPEVAGWIQNGRPGSMLSLSYDIPYGNYPLTDEVAQTWGAAIARSWVPLALWNPAMLVVLAGAAWLTARHLAVSRVVTGLVTAVLVTSPLLIRQLNEPQTDLPAMTWLACTLALSLGAGRRPALLVPAVVAAGLAVGTKTTVAPIALVALATGVWLARGRLRPLAGWLVMGLAAAYVVGGLWYTRNILQHGWPLWPFTEAPWSDPPPRFFSLIDTTFLERPAATLEGRLGEYASRLGGGWMLLAGALVSLVYGLVSRRLKPRDSPSSGRGRSGDAGCAARLVGRLGHGSSAVGRASGGRRLAALGHPLHASGGWRGTGDRGPGHPRPGSGRPCRHRAAGGRTRMEPGRRRTPGGTAHPVRVGASSGSARGPAGPGRGGARLASVAPAHTRRSGRGGRGGRFGSAPGAR